KLVACPPGLYPVADVTLSRKRWQLDHLDTGRDAMQRVCHLLRMLAAWFVVVWQDHYVGAAEWFVVGCTPLPCAHRVACRHQTRGAQCLDVLLPFNDIDHTSSLNGFKDLGQAVQHGCDVLEIPDVDASFSRMGAALLERLRLESYNLED